MPAKRRYRSTIKDEAASQPPGALPLDRPIAVYYRQSSMAQVGNISTDMQQIDLPRYVTTLGWEQQDIILIDEDEGVSGAKRIDERAGMSRLFDLMVSGSIGAVAVQAEDRLFRDETQIQVNVFIEACTKHNVRVLTPHFRYNFADKHEGPYHRLLFRMRAEQAADFLNSYVRGRLFAAKERMLLQGLWMGGNIRLGYMVDNRVNLANGLPNPNWRKYTPFEPCAEVVHKIFEIFVMLGGNKSATLRYLHENGPHFPDFDNPDLLRQVPPGFIWAKPLRMEKRGGVYMVGTVALENMLTNAAYLGHWVFRDSVVQWNNHPAVVSEELFYRAFNYLSPYSLDGTPNPDYAPRLPQRITKSRKDRGVDEPTYVGLVGSFHEDRWRSATATWTQSMQAYAYTVNYRDEADNPHHLWSRRGDYFDLIIDKMLFAKLRATFDPEVWDTVLTSTRDDFDKELQTLNRQLNAVQQQMSNMLYNMGYIKSEAMAEALEGKYMEHQQDQARIESKLARLQQRIAQQDELVRLAQRADTVLANWEKMGLLEKRAVAEVFIERIVVTQTGKHRIADVEIRWRDDSIDQFELPWSAKTWTLWMPAEIETLTRLIAEKASQEEISAALPDRNWRAIRFKAYEIVGERTFHISPKPIREDETYADYIARMEKTGWKQSRKSGPRWVDDEVAGLEQMLDEGATQLELCQAFPYRSWAKIRKKITQLRGKDFKVTKPQVPMKQHETIEHYLERLPEQAAAIDLSAGVSSSPRRRTRTPWRRRRTSAPGSQPWLPG